MNKKGLGKQIGIIKNYNEFGEGVCIIGNNNIIVPGALINEKVEIEVNQQQVARIIRVIEPSIYRMKPKCDIYNRCGGCSFQHISYVHQLEIKTIMIANLFTSKINKNLKVEPCLGMKYPYEYRNKNQIVFGNDPKEKIISGFYEEKSHKIINFSRCLIQDELSDNIVKTIKEIMIKLRLYAYDEDRKFGLIRHVLIKRSFKLNETMVVIITSTDIFPGRSNFMKMLLAKHPNITTVIQNINSRQTSAVLGDKELILHGKGFITDILCGMKFKVSSKSFYQVNPSQTEVLYNEALKMANLSKTDTILDAYSGVGTIGLIASSMVNKVLSVELVKEAHLDAIYNAKMNNIKNVSFFNDDATIFIENIAKRKEKIDVVIMDPPRKGSDERFMKSLIKLQPLKIVYISCNPLTQVEDIKLLLNDYRIIKIQPVDLFAQTSNVENIVLLHLKEK